MSAILLQPVVPSQEISGPIFEQGEPIAGSGSDAHLQRFVVAKSRILSVYQDLSAHVADVKRQVF